jgi:hypothetical protein
MVTIRPTSPLSVDAALPAALLSTMLNFADHRPRVFTSHLWNDFSVNYEVLTPTGA